jgi:protein-disulfide isomerase
VLATVDGAPISAADLDESLRARRAGLEAAVMGARRAALEAEIDDALLQLEAARRKVTLGALLEAEVLRKTPPPAEADVLAVYEQWKRWGNTRPLEALRPALEREAAEKARARREAQFARSLRDRFKVTMGADPGPSPLPKAAVLATVGGRKITGASAATRLDAAAFGVRRNLYFDEKAATEKLVGPKADQGHAVKVLAEMPAPPALDLDASLGASRGKSDAPVAVVEWADFECGHCAHMWPVLEEALKPYGDRVRYVFLNFPLPSHEFAGKAAEAAASARAQGRFFEYADLLFRNQTALDVASLKKYAADAGLDTARFSADLDGGRFAVEVLLERRSGLRAGVFGTPAVFVNGVWLPWDKTSPEDVREAVDRALARKGPDAAR